MVEMGSIMTISYDKNDDPMEKGNFKSFSLSNFLKDNPDYDLAPHYAPPSKIEE
jgi:hypothetical protein